MDDLISRKALIAEYDRVHVGPPGGARKLMEEAPAVEAVPAELLNALKALVNGDWVDSELVEKALRIDFPTGLKMFDFSRTAEWNPAPLNGQKITIKFRLKKAVPEAQAEWKEIKTMAFVGMRDGRPVWEDRSLFMCPRCNFKIRNRISYCGRCGARMHRGKNNV